MDASQFLSVFGVDMGKGSRVIAHRKNLMEDALVKNVKKREALRCQIITILIELWRFNALPRDSIDKMARTTEFILKSMVQHAVLPNFDWKRTVSDAFEKVCKTVTWRIPKRRQESYSSAPFVQGKYGT